MKMMEITEYFENGNIKSKGFTDIYNRRQGKWISYYEDGLIFKEIEYVDNKKNGIFKRYYKNGNIALIVDMKDDEFTGAYAEYYENGSLKEEGWYEDEEYLVKNFWEENGTQTLIDGNGYKIEKYGAFELDQYKKYYTNYKFLNEEKISSMTIVKKESEDNQKEVNN